MREGVLRLIEVEDFDVSACGGTHVARTGAIGIIAVAGAEKFKGGTRLEFLCGGRALAGFHALGDSVAASVRLLSVLPAELPAAIERLQTDARELRRQIKDLQARLAGHEAASLADGAESVGSIRVVVAALDGWDPSGLKTIAAAIAAAPGHVAVLVSTPAPSAIVVARARRRRGRQRRDPQADDGDVRRKGRRPPGARAGRGIAGDTGRNTARRARSIGGRLNPRDPRGVRI